MISKVSGAEIRIKRSDSFKFRSQKKTFELDINRDELFRPDLQAMFSKALKVGYLRKAPMKNHTTVHTYLVVLSDLGLVMLDPDSKLGFLDFLPLVGAEIKEVVTGGEEEGYPADIILGTADREDYRIVFGSSHERNSWYTQCLYMIKDN